MSDINYVVHKFGGSNLIDDASYHIAAQQLVGKNEIIIVSATKQTTSALQALLDKAAINENVQIELTALAQRHQQIITSLFTTAQAAKLLDDLANDLAAIRHLLHAASLIKGYSQKLQAIVIGYGEQWSSKILTQVLNKHNKAIYLNAAEVLHTYHKKGRLYIDWQRSKMALNNFLHGKRFDQLVITGFIACDEQGNQIILDRNSSDFSAAIFAKLFSAKQLIIWKDIDGVFSADPKRVRSAFPITQLSYKSALELAYFGATVIHPRAIMPVMEQNIPVFIKNTNTPEAAGTMIAADITQSHLPVQGITSIDHIALVTIEGTGLIGVSGTAVRVFQVMEQANISVVLISQASSEHSICFAVATPLADKALQALTHAFEFEIQQKIVERIDVDKDCAILAAVGDGMVGAIGVAKKLTATLAKANINIKAMAQGSSERNISLVVAHADISKALNAVHAGFYLSDKTLSVGIIGPGLVGSTLLAQINRELNRLQQQYHVKLLVRGICNSSKMLLSHQAIDLSNWQQLLNNSNHTTNLQQFSEHIIADDMPHAVIIDCTANASIANQYLNFVNQGAHIITPNKRANSGELSYYETLKATLQNTNKHYLYETTVCAGLPVLTTLHDIIKTGDKVLSIQGVVSGTLSYVFNQLAQGIAFSDVINDAKAKGFTEPDPREDLTGMDVARKIVILARELGFNVNLNDVKVYNLVPEALRKCDIATFLNKLPSYDADVNSIIQAKVKPGEQAVYLGTIDQAGNIAVDIKSFPPTHPFARLQGTDNMLIFHTARYCDQPLVIQGPGAGAEVTAAGVFADLLRLVSFIAD